MTSTLEQPEAAAADKSSKAFFSSSERNALLEQLNHYSRYSDLLLMLCGPHSSGKTQLLQHFISQLPGDYECCSIKAKKGLGASYLLGQLVRYLGGDGEPRTLWLARQFADLASRGRSVLLVVDQAEVLEPEALNWLIHFQSQVQSNNWPLHILLVGQDVVAERLSANAEHAEFLLPIQMAPLTLPLAQQFLLQLEQALGRKFPPCSEVKLAQLCEKSEGSFESLLELFKKHTRSASRSSALLKLSLWQYLLLGSAILLLSSLVVLHGLYGESDPLPDDSLGENNLQEIPIPVLVDDIPQPIVTSKESKQPELPVSIAPVIDQSVPPKKQAVVVEKKISNSVSPKLVESQEITAAKEIAVKAPPAPQPLSPAPIKSNKVAEKVVKAPKVSVPKTSVPAVRPAKKPGHHWGWLTQQPKDGFVLQLLGSGNQSWVEDFIAKHPNNQLLWYRTQRQGKSWYVVIQGYYSSRPAAELGAASLPAAIAPQAPWIRTLDQVLIERR